MHRVREVVQGVKEPIPIGLSEDQDQAGAVETHFKKPKKPKKLGFIWFFRFFDFQVKIFTFSCQTL